MLGLSVAVVLGLTQDSGTPPNPPDSNIVTESSDFLITESGDQLITE